MRVIGTGNKQAYRKKFKARGGVKFGRRCCLVRLEHKCLWDGVVGYRPESLASPLKLRPLLAWHLEVW